MKEIDIENLVLSGFQKELKDKSTSYFYQIFMMTMRSLTPAPSGGKIVNYDRFSEELKLWKYYRAGGNPALNELVLRGGKTSEFDESSVVRAVVLFAANEGTDRAAEELFKSCVYITDDFDTYFTALASGLSVIEWIQGTEFQAVTGKLKEIIIGLQTNQLAEAAGRADDRLYKIKFEQKRIGFLQAVDRATAAAEGEEDEYSKYRAYLFNIFGLAEAECSAQDSDCAGHRASELSSEERAFNRTMEFFNRGELEESEYIRSIGRYIYRLRKGRISPESLKFEKKDDISVFSLNEGERFKNSVLGDSVLISIEMRDGFEIRYVKSKSGKYRFFRKIK